MTTPAAIPRCQGLFPVVPTPFTHDGELDLPCQKRCVDFLVADHARQPIH